MNEFFILKKDKEYVLRRIDEIIQKYQIVNSTTNVQRRAIMRQCCRDIDCMLDECYEPSLWGVAKCKQKTNRCFCVDDPLLVDASFYILGQMLFDLKARTCTAIPLKDYPSCRKLVGLSPEDVISKTKDLVKNDIVKAGVCFLLLGLGIGDVISIADIKKLYQGFLDELQKELLEKNDGINPVEQDLMDWFNAEIGYCDLAMCKAGLSIGENVAELIAIAQKNIEKFENNCLMRNSNTVLVKNE